MLTVLALGFEPAGDKHLFKCEQGYWGAVFLYFLTSKFSIGKLEQNDEHSRVGHWAGVNILFLKHNSATIRDILMIYSMIKEQINVKYPVQE